MISLPFEYNISFFFMKYTRDIFYYLVMIYVKKVLIIDVMFNSADFVFYTVYYPPAAAFHITAYFSHLIS